VSQEGEGVGGVLADYCFKVNRLSSTIDGIVEFVNSLTSPLCQQFYVSDKIINKRDNKEIIEIIKR